MDSRLHEMAAGRWPWLILLALAATACTGDARGGAAATARPDPPARSRPPVLAIRAPEGLIPALREGAFFRWGVPRFAGLRVEMGPKASGDAVVWMDRLPVSPEVAALARGLPVGLAGGALAFGGTSYPEGLALALRLPDAARPEWIVIGRTGEEAVGLADEVLFRLASSLTGIQRGRRSAPLEVDYLLRETPWMERTGRWRKAADGGWAIDPAAERDDLAEWERSFAAMAEIRGERVVLRVPPGERSRPELIRLAGDLDRAAGDLAPRVPVALSSPLIVVIEPDHVSQGRHTGEIGEAVPGRRADLHLVYHPDDLFAYRHALARVLMGRAGLQKKLPAAVEGGAALWLSRDWYGRPYPDWLPLLAAARVLPEAGEILAAEEAEDSSELLWTPAAAAVVERLPGKTVAEKLVQAPSAGRVEEILSPLRERAGLDGTAGARPAVGPGNRFPFLKGISLAMLNSLEAGYHAPVLGRQLDAFAALGANAVSLMPFAFQPGPDRPELRYLRRSPGSETDIGLIHATRLSRTRGFHVLYKPHLWIPGGSWPGDVRMKSEMDWAAWWRSYRRYILHHALLARWAGADLFSVGVELSQTTGREAEWRDLIAAVRLFFPGPVTYSGNWHGDLETVRFWDRLDFIGVDAYFPLSSSPQAGRADLEKGAREIAGRLAAASQRFGRPVLLTEVGFAARRGAWVEPHGEGGEYSEDDQAVAYEALFKALGRRPWLAGTFVWKAFSAPGSDSGHEADFRFQGRRAEEVVRRYYEEEARSRR